MHDVVGLGVDDRHRLHLFNPAEYIEASSLLRLVNPGQVAVDVTITGVDDEGRNSDEVVVTVPGRASGTWTAEELETGVMPDGSLGDGTGRWRLVSADDPITVMNLMESPSRQLVNLAHAPSRAGESGSYHVPPFPGASDASGREGVVRVINRSD